MRDAVDTSKPKELKGNLYAFAGLYSLMNNKTEALIFLEKAFIEGYHNYVHISSDSNFDKIRNSSEFILLLEKYNE